MPDADFAAALKRLREEKKMSKAALGRAVGVSGAAVSRMEARQSRPSIDVLTKLADALDCTLDRLCGRRQ